MDQPLQITPLTAFKNPPPRRFDLWSIGFRPFFLGAALFSALSILRWMGIYLLQMPIDLGNIPITHWHSHEMIYGFAMAVVAGFLLTAVQNWTGQRTLYGRSLLAVAALWATPRILLLFGARLLWLAAFADLAFMLFLLLAVAKPVFKTNNYRQLPILAILLALCLGNLAFYAGALCLNARVTTLSIHGGLYLVIGLILFMMHRLFPFFAGNALADAKPFRPLPWLARLTTITYLAWVFFDHILFLRMASISCALLTGGLLFLRLALWYRKGLWSRPLLWSLYAGFTFIAAGLYLHALGRYGLVSGFLSIHAFSYGGMGLVILGMMARVGLGHTGRNVQKPPVTVAVMLIMLLVGSLARIIGPLLDLVHYRMYLALSMGLWAGAFILFTVVYAPILWFSRPDGKAY